MVLEHIFPVFFLMLLGYMLKRGGITNENFLKTSDGVIYSIFFPLLLFWKIGAADQNFVAEDLRFFLAVGCAVLLIYLLSLAVIRIGRIGAFQAGTFSQSSYRFNTYIGMAVVTSALGERGATRFGLLIGLIIPLINVLAVSTLIWFAQEPLRDSRKSAVVFKAILSNPLILGCAAGISYAGLFDGFPPFIDSTLRLSAALTLPLALLSIGGSLTLKGLKVYWGPAMAAAVLKLVVMPLTGFWLMALWTVEGLSFQVGMLFFALPTSTAIYVLSSKLNSDTQLASAAIALSTLLSFFSLSAVIGWLHG